MAVKKKKTYAELLKDNETIATKLEKGNLSPEEAALLIRIASENLRLAQMKATSYHAGTTMEEKADEAVTQIHVKKRKLEDIPLEDRTGVLEFVDVKKNFKGKKVLKGVNASFEPGKVYGFLGNNGAGKTTLMRILFNMENLTGGRIVYKVKDYDKDGNVIVKEISQGDIDYSDWFYFTETDAVPTNYTVHNYLKELAFLYDMPDSEFSYREKEIMNFLDVNFTQEVKISSLSSGQQKLVNCMALLLIKPNIVFLDEPTANMDVWNQRIIMKIIDRLKNENRIIVITTHLLKEIGDSLTDVVILDEGTVRYQAPLKKGDDLQAIFRAHTTDTTELDFNDVDNDPNYKKKKTYEHNSFDRKMIGVYLND